jgi:uncharacterized Zn finger protein (UPF0148 family)
MAAGPRLEGKAAGTRLLIDGHRRIEVTCQDCGYPLYGDDEFECGLCYPCQSAYLEEGDDYTPDGELDLEDDD